MACHVFRFRVSALRSGASPRVPCHSSSSESHALLPRLSDAEYYNSLKILLDVENVEDLCLDFTFTENALGESRVVDLVEGGENINVTNDNLPEFLESNLVRRMLLFLFVSVN